MVEIKLEREKNRAVALEDTLVVGKCEFMVLPNNIWNIIHTEVNLDYQGQGIAKRLVENVMENAKTYGAKVIADCSYAKKFIKI